MKKKIFRDLKVIIPELHAALRRESADVIAVGRLLTEARDQLDHGEWLPWLEENFSMMSVRSAENYMDAARFADKFASVANLKLRPTALYLLGHDLACPSGLYDHKAISAILKAAKTEWISAERAYGIAMSLVKPKPPKTIEEIEAEMAAKTASQKEIDDILDGPPPELPPAPEATVHEVILPSFDQAIRNLKNLKTKPLDKFLKTERSAYDIHAIGDFLNDVADAIDRQPKQKPETVSIAPAPGAVPEIQTEGGAA
jgi:hypothetical protein